MEKIAVQQSSIDESSASDFWKSNNYASVANGKTAQAQSNASAERQSVNVAETVTPTVKISESSAPIVAQRKEPEPIEPVDIRAINNGMHHVELVEPPSVVEAHAPTGPPPTSIDFEWECEFCTYVNEPNTKICIVCCKTPVTLPVRKQPTEPAEVIATAEPVVTMAAADDSTVDVDVSPPTSERNKGKPRKITFWPGTKAM